MQAALSFETMSVGKLNEIVRMIDGRESDSRNTPKCRYDTQGYKVMLTFGLNRANGHSAGRGKFLNILTRRGIFCPGRVQIRVLRAPTWYWNCLNVNWCGLSVHFQGDTIAQK